MEIRSALEAFSLLSHTLCVMSDSKNATQPLVMTSIDWVRLHLDTTCLFFTPMSFACNYIHRTLTGQHTMFALVLKEGRVSRSRSGGGCLSCAASHLMASRYWVFQSSAAILTKLDQPLVHVKISSSRRSLKVALQREARREKLPESVSLDFTVFHDAGYAAISSGTIGWTCKRPELS